MAWLLELWHEYQHWNVNHCIPTGGLHKDWGKKIKTSKLKQIYRVSQEERTKLRESVPYVKLYRYNPKHLYPKLNGYGENGQRKV